MSFIGILDDNLDRQNVLIQTIVTAWPDAKTVCEDNAKDFIGWLAGSMTSIQLITLDHDLGPSRERQGERFDPGTGMDVVDFLVSRKPSFPIIVHSSNPLDGPTMVRRLEEAGWTVYRVIPFGENWIATGWLREMRSALSSSSSG